MTSGFALGPLWLGDQVDINKGAARLLKEKLDKLQPMLIKLQSGELHLSRRIAALELLVSLFMFAAEKVGTKNITVDLR